MHSLHRSTQPLTLFCRLAIVVLSVCAFTGCGGGDSSNGEENDSDYSNDPVTIDTIIDGKVVKVHVKEGDQVNVGVVHIEIHNPSIIRDLEKAKTELDGARTMVAELKVLQNQTGEGKIDAKKKVNIEEMEKALRLGEAMVAM